MLKTLFLPGATGSASFWRPVAACAKLDGVFLSWPGLGDETFDPRVNSLDDLISLVAVEVTKPVNIVAQSMGGYIAIKVALAHPRLVKALVLAVASIGVPAADFGGSDWRPSYFTAYPRAARWIGEAAVDLSNEIPSITAPTLLLWGDADPISPVAAGMRLSGLLPHARLRIFSGADHDLAQTHVAAVAGEVRDHLATLS